MHRLYNYKYFTFSEYIYPDTNYNLNAQEHKDSFNYPLQNSL